MRLIKEEWMNQKVTINKAFLIDYIANYMCNQIKEIKEAKSAYEADKIYAKRIAYYVEIAGEKVRMLEKKTKQYDEELKIRRQKNEL